MIRRQRVPFRRQGRTAAVAELIGMQLHRQSVIPRHLENSGHLRGGKGEGFAVGIDGVGQARRGNRRQHFFTDEIDIAVRVPGVLRRHAVRAQESRDHLNGNDIA